MSDQSLNEVLQTEPPTGYFRELSRWFNEGFWQQSRGWNGYNFNVRSDMPVMTDRQGVGRSRWVPSLGQWVPFYDGQWYAAEGYQSTSQYHRGQDGDQQRRVHWSHTVADSTYSEVQLEEGVSTVVQCCKSEWIRTGWKCYTCGRGLVRERLDPYNEVDSDDSGEGAYVISCTPSGGSTSSSSSSSSSMSPNTQE